MSDVTRILNALHAGNPQLAEQLLPLVYDELRKLAAAKLAQEKPGQTLDATALVHEVYLRLIGGRAGSVSGGSPSPVAHASGSSGPRFDGRGHFFAAAAEAMRRILIEQARRKQTVRHGGQRQREDIDPDCLAEPMPDEELLALNEALDLLAAKDPQKAELVKLRYFAGLTADQAADVLGISPTTADRYWTYARAWLKRAMSGESS